MSKLKNRNQETEVQGIVERNFRHDGMKRVAEKGVPEISKKEQKVIDKIAFNENKNEVKIINKAYTNERVRVKKEFRNNQRDGMGAGEV